MTDFKTNECMHSIALEKAFPMMCLDLDSEGVMFDAPKAISHLSFTFYFPQSCSLSLQGFLNAVVYGWKREDSLLQVVSSRNIQVLPLDLTREKERGLENNRSILVTSGGELNLWEKELRSHDHREVVINI